MSLRARDLVLIPLLVVVTVAGMVWGGRNTYVSLLNRAPVELTCAEYLAARPAARWLVLRDCEADLDHIGVEGRTSTADSTALMTATAVYIPLRPAGASRAVPATLVLHADEGLLLQLGDRYPSPEDVDKAAAALALPLEGIVELALDRSERRKAKLRQLELRVADEFVTFDHGARPRPLWLALGALAVGLGGLARLIVRVRRWLRRGPPALPQATVHRSSR